MGSGIARLPEQLEPGTRVLEASGGWYWFLDELELAGLDPRLVNPLETKLEWGDRNKTDQIGCTGISQLLRNGTLPEICRAAQPTADLGGLMRTRLAFRSDTTCVKNCVHAAIRRRQKNRVRLSLAIGRMPERLDGQ